MPGFNVSRDHSGEAWFRLGRLDVSSTVLLVLAGAVGLVLSAFLPVLVQAGALVPMQVLRGEIWRLVTWPFVTGISLWSVLTLVLLWYFGRDLESQIGRSAMASLYAGLWVTLTSVSVVVGLALGGGVMAGLDGIQFIVLLLWIAEYPRRPFFFGIPAWVVGTVLVAIQVLVYIAGRNVSGLVSLVLTAIVAAFMARAFGLLNEVTWLPGRRASAKASTSGTSRQTKSHKARQKDAARRASDSERMDALLEKISEQGIHSLTAAERKELEALRQRRAR